MKMNKKFFSWIVFSLSLFFLQAAAAQDTTRLSLLFLGDIMQHGSQIEDAYDAAQKKYDYFPCFRYVKPYTHAADLAIGNLELTLAGPPYRGYPQFSAPDALIAALKDMGMDVLVTANNHCVDTGKKGLERTIHVLDSFQIAHTGTFVDAAEKEKLSPLIIDKNGFKLALLNYTFSTNGLPVYSPNIVNMMDTTAIGKDLVKAKSLKPDAIIVFIHWGIEYESLPAMREKKVTEFCFRHGAQLVIGAHPHVVQPMEWRKKENQLVAYSLGNFISGQRKRYTDGGAMVHVALEKIRVNDSLSFTGIDTAGYVLEWVHRSAGGKNYYVLPVPTAEADSMQLLKDSATRLALKTFAADSRALFGTHNKGMVEFNSAPAFEVILVSPVDVSKIREIVGEEFNIQAPATAGGETRIGPFTKQDAYHFIQRIRRPLALAQWRIEPSLR
jgi:hypothetical protein